MLDKGFHFEADFLNAVEIQDILASFPAMPEQERTGGIRSIETQSSIIKDFIYSEKMQGFVRQFLGEKIQFVRAILFNKTAQTNWLVTWHQDRTIAVSQRCDIEGWGPWSCKAGIAHVQPPLEVLNTMLTCRIHLDDVDESNGCLQLIPNSHEHGILSHADIQQLVSVSQPVSCVGKAGSLLAMRPHLLHASSKSSSLQQRRVLHIEYSSFDLPYGLDWV